MTLFTSLLCFWCVYKITKTQLKNVNTKKSPKVSQ